MSLPRLSSICLKLLDLTFPSTQCGKWLGCSFFHARDPAKAAFAIMFHPLLLLLLIPTSQGLPLRSDTFLSSLTRCTGLVTFDLHFLFQDTLALLLSLGLVDL